MSDILPLIEDNGSEPVDFEYKKSTNPESKDIKPFEDTKKLGDVTAEISSDNKEAENWTGPRNEISSLSFEQVNDNADELIELRGEGRYFGVTDPESGDRINALHSLGPICANCHRRGHIRAKCKTVVCHKCGVVGDHYETQCPTTMVCSRCGQKGHIAMNCVNKTRKRQYCKHCDTFSHGDDTCPSIWRSYITLQVPSDSSKLTLPVIFCYNCGDQDHYGDECKEQRTSKIPNFDGSAFSGTNLPRHLRSLYYDIQNGKSNPQRNRSSVYNSHNKTNNAYEGTRNYMSNNNNNYQRSQDHNLSSKNRVNFHNQKHNVQRNQNNDFRNYQRNNNNNQQVPSRSGYLPMPASKSGTYPSKQNYNGKKFKNNGINKPSGNSLTPLHTNSRSSLMNSRSSKSKRKNVKNIKVLY